MAAANAISQTTLKRPGPGVTPNQVLDKITELESAVNKRLDPVESLLKALEQPAKQAGMSPASMIEKFSGDGRFPLIVGGDGSVQIVDASDAQNARSVTKALQKKHGRKSPETDFGALLKDLYTFTFNEPGHIEARDRLAKLGVQRIGGGGKSEVIKTALAESSGITGGYTVPPMFSQQLQMLAVEESVVQGLATPMPLTSRTLLVPSLDQMTVNAAGVSNFLSGVQMQWLAEAATRPETEPQFRQTELTAWELSGYAIASNTLLADNAVGLESVLTMLFSQAIAWYSEYAFLQGNGVGKPMGILNAPASIVVGRNTTSYVRYPDFCNLLGRIWFPLQKSGKLVWMANQTTLTNILQMNDLSGQTTTTVGSGRLVYQTIDQGAKADPGPWTVLGRPLYFTEKLPALGTKGDLILCDWSKYLVGNRMELQIEVSPHVRFLNNQLVWRVVARIDGQPWLGGPVYMQDATSTVSPFCVLNT